MRSSQVRIRGRFAALVPSLALLVAGCAFGASESATIPVARLDALLADFNRGAALLEQYRYGDAAAAFERVVAAAPEWTAPRFNLGLAYLNMQEKETKGTAEYVELARRAFEAVLAAEPGHLHARYSLGLFHQHMGNNPQALECFQKVHEADPNDAHVMYKLGEALAGVNRADEATAMFEKVVAADGGFVSAVYRLALQYQRTGKREKALPLFERFKALNSAELAGGSFAVHKAYGTAGKYYLALGADSLPVPREDPPAARIVFSPEVRTLAAAVVPWSWAGGRVAAPGVACADADNDGDLDLCIAGGGADGAATLWLNDGKGGFSPGALAAARCVAPCFGDVDNDGAVDLLLGAEGAMRIFKNDGKGAFAEHKVFEAPKALVHIARFLDADSDGDLDCLGLALTQGGVPAAAGNAAAPAVLQNNNRDGSYQDIAARLGLPATAVAAVVCDDFDNDWDLDLAVFFAGKDQPVVVVNDRLWKYRPLDAVATGLALTNVVSATSGDPDKDGDRDLLVFTAEGMRLFTNEGRMRFREHAGFTASFGARGGTSGQFADMDNDGDLDLVLADAARAGGTRGPALLVNDWPRDRFVDALAADPGNLLGALVVEGAASVVVADLDGNGACDIVLAPAKGAVRVVSNVTAGNHWIALDLLGVESKDQKARSNASGVGARVEIKTGAVFQELVVGVPTGPAAMAPLRLHAGLGKHTKVDWLRITWPDAVLQAELEVAADQVVKITELPRKISSCPHLFAWDGVRFDFVADFGGMGGLGYLVAPGVYAPPDPTEYLPIPRLAPRDGDYVLQVLEPLEEVVYLDEVKLLAVDHPEGTLVYPHEMMAVSLPPPPFEIFCFKDLIEPVKCIDHRGADVTEALRSVDRVYAGATKLDGRFLGLAEPHAVELDFGDKLRDLAPGARLVLVCHGWVEYGYSSTNFAASQAGLACEAPSVFAFRDGAWKPLLEKAGYPAGLNHVMTLDLAGKVLPTDTRLRIASNLELYWDRIFLAVHRAGAVVAVKEVAARSADLHFAGYPREYSPDGRLPNLLDYGSMERMSVWKLMEGAYTRFGDVKELLDAADDRYVIMGRGEEVTLKFPAAAFGAAPSRTCRSFILKTDSYCKDMDLYTAHGEGVEPLPFHAMTTFPYKRSEKYPDDAQRNEYRAMYNTRMVRTR